MKMFNQMHYLGYKMFCYLGLIIFKFITSTEKLCSLFVIILFIWLNFILGPNFGLYIV